MIENPIFWGFVFSLLTLGGGILIGYGLKTRETEIRSSEDHEDD